MVVTGMVAKVSHRRIGLLALTGLVVLAAAIGWLLSSSGQRSEETAEEVVSRLSTGVTLDRFVGILGRPPDISRPAGMFREVLWVNDAYAVQAVLGDAGVLGYSVTTLSEQFRPPIDAIDGAELGSTPIAEAVGVTGDTTLVSALPPTPRGVWWYSEAIPAGGATHDQAIVLTASDAGDYPSDTPAAAGELLLTAVLDPRPFSGPFSAVPVADVRAARGLPPSTYSIIGPQLSLDQLPADFRFGPTRDDIQAVR